MHPAESFTRASAFTARSIRQESRLMLHHLLRGGVALSVLMALFLQSASSALYGAAGLNFYGSICFLVYWFLTLTGNLYFSVAIAEEKDEDTLPLLRMTGVSEFALLLGKSIPRLAIVILILLVILPFSMLSITLGGLTLRQIVASQICFLCYAFFLCQAGLLAGTIARSGKRAFQVSVVIWFVFELGYLVIYLLAEAFREYRSTTASHMLEQVAEWLKERSLLMTLGNALHLDDTDSLLMPQCLFQLISGGVLFLLCWLVFERFTRAAMGQDNSSPSVLSQLMSRSGGQRKSFTVTGNALSWKTWRFLSGGIRGLALRAIITPPLAFGIPFSIAAVYHENPEPIVFAVSLWLTAAILWTVDLSRQIGRVLNDEVYRQTISSLSMLPMSTAEIVNRLIFGIIPSLLPNIFWFVVGVVIHISLMSSTPNDRFYEIFVEPWFWHFLSWVMVTLFLGLYMSTQLRYGGVLIAVALAWFAGPFLMMILFGFLTWGGGVDGEIMVRFLAPICLIVVELIACVALYRLTIRNLENIAARA